MVTKTKIKKYVGFFPYFMVMRITRDITNLLSRGCIELEGGYN